MTALALPSTHDDLRSLAVGLARADDAGQAITTAWALKSAFAETAETARDEAKRRFALDAAGYLDGVADAIQERIFGPAPPGPWN